MKVTDELVLAITTAVHKDVYKGDDARYPRLRKVLTDVPEPVITQEQIRQIQSRASEQEKLALFWKERAASFDAALADVPEPMQGPFVLSDNERTDLATWRTWALSTYPHAKPLVDIVDRAVRTLAAPGPFVLSDDDRKAISNARRFGAARKLLPIIDRAVRTLEAPAVAPAPEEYSEEQVQAALRAWFADPDSIDKNGDMRAALAAAGVRALAAPDPLSEELRAEAEEMALWNSEHSQVAAELLRRCPKPKPARKTPKELGDFIYEQGGFDDDTATAASRALAELVRRAEENEKP